MWLTYKATGNKRWHSLQQPQRRTTTRPTVSVPYWVSSVFFFTSSVTNNPYPAPAIVDDLTSNDTKVLLYAKSKYGGRGVICRIQWWGQGVIINRAIYI